MTFPIQPTHARRFLSAIALVAPGVFLPADASSTGTRPFGYQLRIREVYVDNAVDLEDDNDDRNHFFRIRSALWGRCDVGEGFRIYARLTHEFRRYLHPEVDFEPDEAIFENLYVRWTNAAGLPVDLTLGRQNVILGEGFLVMDGGPLDGSRTFYQNGLRATWRAASETIDAVAISNPRKDEYLPVINDQDRNLVESDEVVLGAYVSSRRWGGTELAPYYFYKREDPRPAAPKRLDLHTIGLRGARRISRSLKLVAEYALQHGQRTDDVRAHGGYAYLQIPADPEGHALTLGVVYLSGERDRPLGAWNPLLSRWPKWSELYIYTLARESGVALWQNLASAFLRVDRRLGERADGSIRVYALDAPERRVPGAEGFRGWNLQAEVRFRLHPAVSGHLLAEMFLPGEFYPGTRVTPEPIVGKAGTQTLPSKVAQAFGTNDAVFLRWELLFDL